MSRSFIHSFLDFRSKEAFGRVQRLNLRLLEYDDWIYVPQCQDPTPMTEDMLAEHAEVFVTIRPYFFTLINKPLALIFCCVSKI